MDMSNGEEFFWIIEYLQRKNGAQMADNGGSIVENNNGMCWKFVKISRK